METNKEERYLEALQWLPQTQESVLLSDLTAVDSALSSLGMTLTSGKLQHIYDEFGWTIDTHINVDQWVTLCVRAEQAQDDVTNKPKENNAVGTEASTSKGMSTPLDSDDDTVSLNRCHGQGETKQEDSAQEKEPAGSSVEGVRMEEGRETGTVTPTTVNTSILIDSPVSPTSVKQNALTHKEETSVQDIADLPLLHH